MPASKIYHTQTKQYRYTPYTQSAREQVTISSTTTGGCDIEASSGVTSTSAMDLEELLPYELQDLHTKDTQSVPAIIDLTDDLQTTQFQQTTVIGTANTTCAVSNSTTQYVVSNAQDVIAHEASKYSMHIMQSHNIQEANTLGIKKHSTQHNEEELTSTQTSVENKESYEQDFDYSAKSDTISDTTESAHDVTECMTTGQSLVHEDDAVLAEATDIEKKLVDLLSCVSRAEPTTYAKDILQLLHNIILLMETRCKQLQHTYNEAEKHGTYQDLDDYDHAISPSITKMQHFIDAKITNDYRCIDRQCKACYIMSAYKTLGDNRTGSALLECLALTLNPSDVICPTIFACFLLRPVRLQKCKFTVAHDKFLYALDSKTLSTDMLNYELDKLKKAISNVWQPCKFIAYNKSDNISSSISVYCSFTELATLRKHHALHVDVLRRNSRSFKSVVSHFFASKVCSAYKAHEVLCKFREHAGYKEEKSFQIYGVSQQEHQMKLEIYRRVTQINTIRTKLLQRQDVVEILLYRLPVLGYYLFLTVDDFIDIHIKHKRVSPCKLFCCAVERFELAAERTSTIAIVGQDKIDGNQSVLKMLDPLTSLTTKVNKNRTQSTGELYRGNIDEKKIQFILCMYKYLCNARVFSYHTDLFDRVQSALTSFSINEYYTYEMRMLIGELYDDLTTQLAVRCGFKQMSVLDSRLYCGNITCNDVFSQAIIMNAAEEAMTQAYHIVNNAAINTCHIFVLSVLGISHALQLPSDDTFIMIDIIIKKITEQISKELVKIQVLRLKCLHKVCDYEQQYGRKYTNGDCNACAVMHIGHIGDMCISKRCIEIGMQALLSLFPNIQFNNVHVGLLRAVKFKTDFSLFVTQHILYDSPMHITRAMGVLEMRIHQFRRKQQNNTMKTDNNVHSGNSASSQN